MARKNKKGSAFLGLDLGKELEDKLKLILKEEDMSAKRLIRYLMKKYIGEYKLKPKKA